MKRTLFFYNPEYADLAIKLRDNYRAHGHEETDIVSVEERIGIYRQTSCLRCTL